MPDWDLYRATPDEREAYLRVMRAFGVTPPTPPWQEAHPDSLPAGEAPDPSRVAAPGGSPAASATRGVKHPAAPGAARHGNAGAAGADGPLTGVSRCGPVAPAPVSGLSTEDGRS